MPTLKGSAFEMLKGVKVYDGYSFSTFIQWKCCRYMNQTAYVGGEFTPFHMERFRGNPRFPLTPSRPFWEF
jgi:hypothetical protein